MLEIDEKMENIKEELRKENQEEMEYIKNELFSYSAEENHLPKKLEAHENETSDNLPFDEEDVEFFADQIYQNMQDLSHSPYSTLMKEPIKGKIRK